MNLEKLDLKNKKVLIRVDYNVPLDEKGAITDDTKIRESLPTLRYVLSQGASVILMSHLGRPKKIDPKLSLRPCAEHLATLLSQPVLFATDCVGSEVSKQAKALHAGEVLLLENLRFHPAEEEPTQDPSFAKQLAALGDLYINDAFGTAHRAHSSTVEIARYFPHRKVPGLLMQKEIAAFETLLKEPKRPFYAIVGGSKISTKLGVLKALVTKVDALFIGGGMSYTFFKAQNFSIGNSIFEADQVEEARSFLKQCKENNLSLFLPKDLRIADKQEEGAKTHIITPQQGIPDGWEGVDIGPETLHSWEKALAGAATLFWNGPLGVFEIPSFATGTNQIARFLSHLKATTIIGGGDSVAAIQKLGIGAQFSHLSTGGGAALEWIEFGHLPGIDILKDY